MRDDSSQAQGILSVALEQAFVVKHASSLLLGIVLVACSGAADDEKQPRDPSRAGNSGIAGSNNEGNSGAGGGSSNSGRGGSNSGAGGTASGSGGSAGSVSVGGAHGGSDSQDGLGPCSGTADECEAARAFNEYRISHFAQGECNNELIWHDTLGKFAHDWAEKTFENPEHSFGPYGESLGAGDDIGIHEMVFFVSEYDPPGEDHCAPDGSFVASHHCNTMRCDAFTIGVGVVRKNSKLYIVVEFGGKDGASI